MLTVPNKRDRTNYGYRSGVLRMTSDEDKKTNIFHVIDRHKKYSYALEAAYKIILAMPKDVRKEFLWACEEIKA